MARVRWTAKARDDLRSIHSHIARDSLGAANRLRDTLTAATRRLASFPESGRVVPEFDRADYREIIAGSYRIIYRVEPGRSVVTITMIVHGHRLLTPSMMPDL